MNAITIEHLTKRYPDFALQDIDLALPQGAILGLIGENGAGKSTLIRLLLNAVSRDSGRITVLGTDNTDKAFRQVKEDIGVVLDEAYFPQALSARQVGNCLSRTFRSWDQPLFEQFLARFGLPDKKLFQDYSRGMRMKLAIAAALSHHPRLLLLDEATAGLDPLVRDEILEIFNDFTRDETHSILISSHIVSDLEKLCDYVAFLHKGQLLLCREKDRLLEEHLLVSATPSLLDTLDPGSVIGRQRGVYGDRALIRREALLPDMAAERPTLEDVILFSAKGVNGQ